MGAVRSKFSKAVANSLRTTRSIEKVLDKEKPAMAPRHKTTADKIDNFIKAHPEIEHEQKKKDTSYLSMLSKLHVESQDPEVVTAKIEQQTQIMNQRITIDQLLELFEKHQADPDTWTVDHIANTYKLNPETVTNLCKYYSAFNVKKVPPRENPLKLTL